MEHQPRKRFGQNFLHDESVIQRIVQAIRPRADDHVVEIGPGQGALTRHLLPAIGQLDAVELDRDLLPILQRELGGLGSLTIHNEDALKFDFCRLSRGEKLRVVGNLPYNISTPLLFHLLEQRHCIADMHFMLQKEVVDRMVAPPGDKAYGRLGIMIQLYCETERLFVVRPGAFFPPPKVDSAIIRLRPRDGLAVELADEALFAQVVKQAFGQRRKTLRNNLKGLLSAEQLQSLDIDPSLRAETLGIEQFARIANFLAQQC
jgi:16S rRNA (adenine1518-N6/adenine1519-N6)-dimethyltransferase